MHGRLFFWGKTEAHIDGLAGKFVPVQCGAYALPLEAIIRNLPLFIGP